MRQRTARGETATETVFGITSLPREKADAPRLLKLVRAHRPVESPFRVRDLTFGEDDCRASAGSAGSAPHVLSGLRNAAITLPDQSGVTNKAAALRRHAAHPHEALALVKAGSG